MRDMVRLCLLALLLVSVVVLFVGSIVTTVIGLFSNNYAVPTKDDKELDICVVSVEYEQLRCDMAKASSVVTKVYSKCEGILGRDALEEKDRKSLCKVLKKLDTLSELLKDSNIRINAMREIVGGSFSYDDEVEKAQLEDKYNV